MALGDVCNILRGNYITKKDTIPGDIPVILGGKEPAYYCNKSNHEGEALVVSRSGAYAGFVSYWNQPIFVTDGFIVESKMQCLLRFVYYVLKNKQEALHELKRGSGVPHITGEILRELKVPVPPLAEQERIISILDKFDALVSDLTSGLPAELAARRQQYEYYRDRLLSFTPISQGA